MNSDDDKRFYILQIHLVALLSLMIVLCFLLQGFEQWVGLLLLFNRNSD